MGGQSKLDREASQFKIKRIMGMVDSTLLKVGSTKEDVKDLCENAVKNGFAMVCVFPTQVKDASKILKKLQGKEPKVAVGEVAPHRVRVCSVVGFPYGENLTKVKVVEEKLALISGADEIDFVINQTDVKRGDYKSVKTELIKLVKTAKNCNTKAILEIGNLNDEEITKCVELCIECGVKYIKTSTGILGNACKAEDIKKLTKIANGRIKIKASAGVKTAEQFMELYTAGADRIGTSCAVEIAEQISNNLSLLDIEVSEEEPKKAEVKQEKKEETKVEVKEEAVEEVVEEIAEEVAETDAEVEEVSEVEEEVEG